MAEISENERMYEKLENNAGACSEGVYEKLEGVVYKLRDRNPNLVAAWEEYFQEYTDDQIQISCGDIFEGAPSADAIVSPANSFGFMDGGIDMVYSRHFGWQMQERLQQKIRQDHHGELLVGRAEIIPAYGDEDEPYDDLDNCNEGIRFKYLISAPTMRVPLSVDDTANAFVAFRAVIIAVKRHNSNPDNERIRSVLCPGLATAVGRMPPDRCAYQMLQAYKMHYQGELDKLKEPARLISVRTHHYGMQKHKRDTSKPKFEKKKQEECTQDDETSQAETDVVDFEPTV